MRWQYLLLLTFLREACGCATLSREIASDAGSCSRNRKKDLPDVYACVIWADLFSARCRLHSRSDRLQRMTLKALDFCALQCLRVLLLCFIEICAVKMSFAAARRAIMTSSDTLWNMPPDAIIWKTRLALHTKQQHKMIQHDYLTALTPSKNHIPAVTIIQLV